MIDYRFASSLFRGCAFSLGAFGLSSALAAASPALPGFTGVLTTPNAFSQAFQSGAVGLANSGQRGRAFLNYGLWETGELTVAGDPLDPRLHAKYTLRPEAPRRPAVAVGGAGLLGGSPSLYVVAGGNLRVRSGGSRLRLAGGVATRGLLPPLFTSAELRLGRVALLQTEWSRGLNIGLRMDPTAQFRLQVGLVHSRAALGVSYDVGL
jgi:hypothetical protein